MRRFVTTTLSLLLLVPLFAGCDTIIEDPQPSTAISQETALTDPDGVRGVRADMFSLMHSPAASTDWLLGPSAQADNTFFRGNQQRHQGLNLNLRGAGIGTGAYFIMYRIINDANLLISAVEPGVLQEPEATRVRAEGFFMRALAMHHLVRIFGYDPDGTGGVLSPTSGPGQGFDLGIEIRTTPTLSVEDAVPLARSTVPEVYAQIKSDLNESISLFSSGDVADGSSFFPSEAAAQGLLARVLLYERDYRGANSAAQAAIDAAAAQFGSGLAAPNPSSLRGIFDEESGGNPEAIYTVRTTAQESAGVNNSLAAYTSVGSFMAQLPTQDLISLYEPGDARLAGWYAPCFNEIDEIVPEGCPAVNDAGFELKKYAAESGPAQYADDYIHLRIGEMYLIQAEARLNTSGVDAAIGRLNELRLQRAASELDPASYTAAQALDEILDERRRELVAEGHRYFDLKRLGRDIRKVQGRSDLPYISFRILDDFPNGQLSVNTELVQNPGYN